MNTIATMVVKLRRKTKLTQSQLAMIAGTKQSVIARLESGTDKRVPSLDLLGRIVSASNMKLNVSFFLDSKKSISKRTAASYIFI
jgi:transcriptional regulator with XRE-family HTH domain